MFAVLDWRSQGKHFLASLFSNFVLCFAWYNFHLAVHCMKAMTTISKMWLLGIIKTSILYTILYSESSLHASLCSSIHLKVIAQLVHKIAERCLWLYGPRVSTVPSARHSAAFVDTVSHPLVTALRWRSAAVEVLWTLPAKFRRDQTGRRLIPRSIHERRPARRLLSRASHSWSGIRREELVRNWQLWKKSVCVSGITNSEQVYFDNRYLTWPGQSVARIWPDMGSPYWT